MQYKINDIVLKSHNAAKSNKQQSSFLVDLIKSEPMYDLVLDYGCGKLRYLDALLQISEKQIFVDSDIQLKRIQTIHGKKDSVVNYINKLFPNSQTVSINNLDFKKHKSNFILCSNVLSAIPLLHEREKLVSNIKNLLNIGGKALFVVQYRDASFDNYKYRANSVKHLDGYIIKNGTRSSFYGILKPDQLTKFLKNNEMTILDKIDRSGSVYIYAK